MKKKLGAIVMIISFNDKKLLMSFNISLLKTTPIKPSIGAVIEGVDLNHLDDVILNEIQNLLLKHCVIFFRKQDLAPQSQVALAKSFGSLHIHPIFPTVDGVPELIVLDSHQLDLRDNELWHTDVTFSQTPPLGCVLAAIKIPPVGGDTLWANSIAAYDALSEKDKQRIHGLTAVHDIRLSFPSDRFAQSKEEKEKLDAIMAKNPPVSHPVVRTHPQTRRKGLFVSEGFTDYIENVSAQESRAILDFLFAHAVRDEFTLRWQWQEGDVAIWDNRCTQHKALFDYGDAHRIMRRATINGSRPFFDDDQKVA